MLFFFFGQLTTKITQICCSVESRERAEPAAQLALASVNKTKNNNKQQKKHDNEAV